MKKLGIVVFLLTGNLLNAQTIQSDLALLRAQRMHPSPPAKEKKAATLLSRVTTLPGDFYRNHVAGQWGHSCYFEIPCAPFSHQLIHRYGIVKGFFLTIDRHVRCNKLSQFETLSNRFTAKGKIIDSVSFYGSR